MSNFSEYILLTDLDGTFLSRAVKPVPRNIEAVRRFVAGGGIFTFNTGRLHLNLRKTLGEPAALCNAPAVLSNGAYLYDFSKNKALEEEFMPADVARELLSLVVTDFPDVMIRASTPYSLRVTAVVGCLVQDVTIYDEGSIETLPIEKWRYDDLYKVVFRADHARPVTLRQVIAERFGDAVEQPTSSSDILEAELPGCSKGSGLQKLRRYLDMPTRKIVACGDYENDLSMLSAADISAAPQSALPIVKETADAVFCDCDGGVIADVIEAIEAGTLKRKKR